MIQPLASVPLKSGESLSVVCVQTPEPSFEARVLPLLGHKPTPYNFHLEAAFADRCDALETRFYLGLIGDDVVGNIMTTERHGVGVFGHVFTRPEHRRKGICSAIMREQMADFQRRDGKSLLLGTGYQSNPYYIYASFGFVDWPHGPQGRMRYDTPTDPEFLTRFFAADSPTTIQPARWEHWPLVVLLASLPGSGPLRSLALNLWNTDILEGPYCGLMRRKDRGEAVEALVLQSATGAVTALATLTPDPRWPGVRLLDLFAHPSVPVAPLAALVRALPLPTETPVQSWVDREDTTRLAALEQAGLTCAAVLPRQFRDGARWLDAALYTVPVG